MKCDISITKKLTINTGNYTSVSPQLILTLKDVDVRRISEIHKKLDIITDGLYHKQLLSDIDTMATMKKMGLEDYLTKLDVKEIDKEVEKNIRELKDDEGF